MIVASGYLLFKALLHIQLLKRYIQVRPNLRDAVSEEPTNKSSKHMPEYMHARIYNNCTRQNEHDNIRVHLRNFYSHVYNLYCHRKVHFLNASKEEFAVTHHRSVSDSSKSFDFFHANRMLEFLRIPLHTNYMDNDNNNMSTFP